MCPLLYTHISIFFNACVNVRTGSCLDTIRNSDQFHISLPDVFVCFVFLVSFPQLFSFTFCLPLLWGCLIWAWLLSSDFFSTCGVCQSSACGSHRHHSVVQWVWHITAMLTVCARVSVCLCVHARSFLAVIEPDIGLLRPCNFQINFKSNIKKKLLH